MKTPETDRIYTAEPFGEPKVKRWLTEAFWVVAAVGLLGGCFAGAGLVLWYAAQ